MSIHQLKMFDIFAHTVAGLRCCRRSSKTKVEKRKQIEENIFIWKKKTFSRVFHSDRSLASPQPPIEGQDERKSESGKKESGKDQKEVAAVASEDDRKVADILLAAELENEMEVMAEGEDGDEEVFADDGEEVDGEGYVDRSHLVGKPKRKRELKAGLLRWKSHRGIYSSLFFAGSSFSTSQSVTPSVDCTCDAV